MKEGQIHLKNLFLSKLMRKISIFQIAEEYYEVTKKLLEIMYENVCYAREIY
jgi:hypothetical protein